MKKLILLAAGLCASPFVSLAQGPWVQVPNTPGTATTQAPPLQAAIKAPQANVLWGTRVVSLGTAYWGCYVYASADNGLTWQDAQVATYTSQFNTMNGSSLVDFYALDGQTAWVINYSSIPGPAGIVRTYTLYKTTTGPSGFSAQPTPVSQLRGITFFSATEGLLLGSQESQGSWDFYRTTNGGSSWTALTGLPTRAANESILNYTTLGNQVWVLTSTGKVLYSSDAGLTWGSSNIGTTPVTSTVWGVSFRDAQHGLVYGDTPRASGGYTAYWARTADGGQTWQAFTPTGPAFTDNVVRMPGTGTYLSGGSEEYGFRSVGSSISTDDGATWQQLESVLNHQSMATQASGQVWTMKGGEQTFPGSGIRNGTLYRFNATALATAGAARLSRSGFYPSPSAGQLQAPAGLPAQPVRVLDALGRLQRTAQLSSQASLNLQDLPAGLYQLQFRSADGQQHTQRIVLQP